MAAQPLTGMARIMAKRAWFIPPSATILPQPARAAWIASPCKPIGRSGRACGCDLVEWTGEISSQSALPRSAWRSSARS